MTTEETTEVVSPKPKPELKCIVIGSSGTGKTAIIYRLVKNKFTGSALSTIGVEYDESIFTIGKEEVLLKVWDTAGQENYRSMTRKYFRDAVCVLVVFDLTKKESFDDLNDWLKDVHELCHPLASIVLVGNKSDLAEARVISANDATQYAQERNLQYIETSAKTGENVREAFIRTAAEAIEKFQNNEENEEMPAVVDKKKICC